MSDPINPKHYKHLPAEAIDIIMAAIAKAPSNQAAYLQGQVLKYLLRYWEKKGIEDLRKAKWYLDRMVASFDESIAEASEANETPSDELTPKPSKTQPPSGYRLLGPAKDEPRQAVDLYWSLSDRDWVSIDQCVEYANRDNWRAWRKIQTPSEPPRRYRDPTLEDLRDGPIECEVRDTDNQNWTRAMLHDIDITNHARPCRFWAKKLTLNAGLYYAQCRIEVAE